MTKNKQSAYGDYSDYCHLYVLECANNYHYVGISKNPKSRITRHFAGVGGKRTQENLPQRVLLVTPGMVIRRLAEWVEYDVEKFLDRRQLKFGTGCVSPIRYLWSKAQQGYAGSIGFTCGIGDLDELHKRAGESTHLYDPGQPRDRPDVTDRGCKTRGFGIRLFGSGRASRGDRDFVRHYA